MKSGWKNGIILFVLLACFGAVSYGYPITIGITANVTYVEDGGNYLEGKIKVGDTITGSYTYESTTADSNPRVDIGDYYNYSSSSGIELTCGGFVFKTNPTNINFLIEIGNDAPWFDPTINTDSYLVKSSNNLPLSNGTAVDNISWQLDDSSGKALSSDALPLIAPVLNDWPSSVGLRLDADRMYLLRGNVTSVRIIPEPATLALLGVGLPFLRAYLRIESAIS